MNFSSIDNLSDNQIKDLFDDVINSSENISVECKVWANCSCGGRIVSYYSCYFNPSCTVYNVNGTTLSQGLYTSDCNYVASGCPPICGAIGKYFS